MPNHNIDTVRLAQSLQPIYQQFSHQYTKGVRIPETLPAPMRQAFYKSLEDYDRTMSTELSRLVVQSFVNADDVRDGLRPISAGMRQQTRRLSNTYYQMERRVQVYETLAYQADYPILLYLSERGENTCEPCQRYHGTLLHTSELFAKLWMIPPVHPNCKCRLVAMDTVMASRYNQNQGRFMAQLEAAMRQYAPVYRLDHRAVNQGIGPTTLTPLRLRQFPVVTESEEEGPSWLERLTTWSTGWLSNALNVMRQWSVERLREAVSMVEALMERGQVRLQQMAAADPLLAVPLFVDFLFLTMPSSLAEGIEERVRRTKDKPNIFNILNTILMGLGDELNGAMAPEKPWSFQHFLDMTGSVTAIIGVALGVKNILDGRGVLTDAQRAPYASLNDGLDDAARAAARQMDDLVEEAAEQVGTVVKTMSADELNRSYLLKNPTHEPPYWPDTTAYEVRLTKTTRFVRVYGGNSWQQGRWLMLFDDIAGLTAEQIKNKFALPEKPLYICDVEVPTGTIVQISGAGGVMGGSGGGMQIFLEQPDAKWFVKEQILQ